ncbi:histidinol-phosphate transaminase [Metabacillus fastidiosus]|uniref:histidinol-phosphate transaminase n=1 Tax=Metabacillus fastidiosus TaxID=1458 RepID=UPI003D2E138E
MYTDKKIQPRKALQHIQPYQPGKPIWEVQKELGIDRVIKLASNENPLGPSPKAVEAISASLLGINRYPDANATNLKKVIASHLQVQMQQIIPTNGADELITLISETFLEEGDEVIVPSPSFSEYDFGAHLMGAKVVHVPLGIHFEYDVEAIVSAVTERTKIIYICSPNNPTGTYLPKEQLQQLLDSLPEKVLVIFDGAYSHYAEAESYTNGLEFVTLGYPIIVLQTFSKIYGLAGIRIGFGVALEEIVQSILKVKEPFNVNMLAQEGAVAALADREHIQKSQEINKLGREWLYRAFSNLGLHYIESMSNFILVKIGMNAKDVYEKLLAKGVILRYGGAWGLPDYVRISVGTPEENAILIGLISSTLQNED